MNNVANELAMIARVLMSKSSPDNLSAARRDVHSLVPLVESELLKDDVNYKDVRVGEPMGSVNEFSIHVVLALKSQFDDDRVLVFNACYNAFLKWAAKHHIQEADYKQMGSYPMELGIWMKYE